MQRGRKCDKEVFVWLNIAILCQRNIEGHRGDSIGEEHESSWERTTSEIITGYRTAWCWAYREVRRREARVESATCHGEGVDRVVSRVTFSLARWVSQTQRQINIVVKDRDRAIGCADVCRVNS